MAALMEVVRRLSKPAGKERRLASIFALLLLVGEACLCALIIYAVPYTKIDFDAYMQQVRNARFAF